MTKNSLLDESQIIIAVPDGKSDCCNCGKAKRGNHLIVVGNFSAALCRGCYNSQTVHQLVHAYLCLLEGTLRIQVLQLRGQE